MKLLFCKPKYIGDTLLLTGTLRAVKRFIPGAEITVLVRGGSEGILAGCPEIDDIVAMSRPGAESRLRSDLRTLRTLRSGKFDYAFELGDGDRGRILTLLSGAKTKVANTHPVHMKSGFWRARFGELVHNNYNNPGLPRAQWDFGTVASALEIPQADVTPVFDRDKADFKSCAALTGTRPFWFAHPTASVGVNMWPAEKWSELLDTLVARHDVVLSCGPSPAEAAYCQSIMAGMKDASRVRFTGGKLSWAAMAGVLYSSLAYIGADTAAMHLASACRIPILGIFGRNSAEHLAQWTPAGDRVRIVTFSANEAGIAGIPASRVLDALVSVVPET